MKQPSVKEYKDGLIEYNDGSFEHEPTPMSKISKPDFYFGLAMLFTGIICFIVVAFSSTSPTKRQREKEKELIQNLRNQDRVKYGYQTYKSRYKRHCNRVRASERECIGLYENIQTPQDYDLFLYKCITCRATNSNKFYMNLTFKIILMLLSFILIILGSVMIFFIRNENIKYKKVPKRFDVFVDQFLCGRGTQPIKNQKGLCYVYHPATKDKDGKEIAAKEEILAVPALCNGDMCHQEKVNTITGDSDGTGQSNPNRNILGKDYYHIPSIDKGIDRHKNDNKYKVSTYNKSTDFGKKVERNNETGKSVSNKYEAFASATSNWSNLGVIYNTSSKEYRVFSSEDIVNIRENPNGAWIKYEKSNKKPSTNIFKNLMKNIMIEFRSM